MATRVDGLPLDNTRELLQRLLPLIGRGERVMFLVPRGEAGKIESRIRVAISRARQNMRNRGKKLKHFTLRCTTHKHTEDGKIYDAVVMWREVERFHEMREMLEDVLTL